MIQKNDYWTFMVNNFLLENNIFNTISNIFLESFFSMAEKDLTDSMYKLDDYLSRVDHDMNGVCFLKFFFETKKFLIHEIIYVLEL